MRKSGLSPLSYEKEKRTTELDEISHEIGLQVVLGGYRFSFYSLQVNFSINYYRSAQDFVQHEDLSTVWSNVRRQVAMRCYPRIGWSSNVSFLHVRTTKMPKINV